MKPQLHIADLLTIHSMGPMKLYATRDDVEYILGIPDEIEVCRTVVYLIYGPLEIGFRRSTSILESLVIFFNSDGDDERAHRMRESHNLLIDYDFFKTTNVKNIIQYLADQGQEFIIDPLSYAGENHIVYRPLIKQIDVELDIDRQTDTIFSIGAAWKWRRPRHYKM